MKPILFNTEMVRAILDGRKSVTRRAIKGFIPDKAKFGQTMFTPENHISCRGYVSTEYAEKFFKLPYQEGDILYVRETWRRRKQDDCSCYECNGQCGFPECIYKADGWDEEGVKWKSPVAMPKALARIFLKVTDVKVERLQDITVNDIEKEGYPKEIDFSEMPIAMQGVMFEWWADTWNSTIKKQDIDRYGWEVNPWVWVIEFERIMKC